MKALVIGLLYLFVFWSCNTKEQRFRKELNNENLVQLELSNLNISIAVPRTHRISEMDNEYSFNLNPHGRGVKWFSISDSKSSVPKEKYKKSFSFNNGAILNYDIFVAGGGSGGNEHELQGVLEFNGKTFQIGSSIQTDSARGEIDFCLKYLSTIQSLK